MAEDEKEKALEVARKQIENNFGKGAIMKLGEGRRMDVDSVSTGSLSLDIALGVGGIPRGRTVEIFGPEASGKTTLALHIIAEAQKDGGTAAIIDAEHAVDPEYASSIGVDTEELLISQPDTGEQALEIAEILARSNAVDVIAIDSVAALVPKAEIEGEMGDQHVGLQARLMSQAMRKLTGIISKSDAILIFVNQIREKIGVIFGNPETTPGGRALPFYASVRIEVRRRESIKDGDEAIGTKVKAKVVKNKVAPPFKEVEFDIIFGEGINREGDILDLGVEEELIEKAGAWYSYGETRLGQGRQNARETLEEDPELTAEIEAKLREAKMPAPEDEEEDDEATEDEAAQDESEEEQEAAQAEA